MIQPPWKAFFIFSNKEIKGIIVLGIILFGSVSIRFLFPSKGLSTKELEASGNVKTTKHLVHFDPNTIDSLQAIQLGLPAKQVNNLLRYRAKGGYFRAKEDFAKLYGLTPALYSELSPYITIVKLEKNRREGSEVNYVYERGHSNFEKEDTWKIDINIATEAEWKQKTMLPLYLIKRIMSYKQFRGAFTKPSEIAKVYGLSDSIYLSLRGHLVVKVQTSNLLNANAMNFNDWKVLGLFSEAQIWTILKLKRSMKGRLNWESMVEALDLTQAEAVQLKGTVRFSD